ncbi:MAG: hypothetical protein OXQ90_14460 [Gammaproteobacteria bacterium]|nr:hypothetical protein [Gammaproteobacteria bacterium]
MDKRNACVDRDGTVSVPEEGLDVEIYDDDQISQWDADDGLDDDERQCIADALARQP